MIFHAARAIVIAPIARKRGPFGRTPSASGAFARRRPSPVSYHHPTPPTKGILEIPVVAGA
ncbi:hypothetical protein DIJ60_38840 [Burkholderia pseudomallei]|nr:hypothetical protein DIJ60_38840 [Burkholderia pseudomallei]